MPISQFAKLRGTMLTLALTLVSITYAHAKSGEHTYNILAPINVITDRKSTTQPPVESSTLGLIHSIHAGIVQVPLRLKMAEPLDLSSLEKWGCVCSDHNYGGRISRRSIESQVLGPSSTAFTISPGSLDTSKDLGNFFANLNEQIAKSSNHELLIFIHGCCEGPQDSLESAARLSIVTGCPVLLFDWASPSVRQAGIWSYIQSDRALELSELYFGKLMEGLKDKTLNARVTIVAYSMGAKLVRNYLRQYPDCFIDQIHLVRPDISLPVFLMEQDKFKNQYGQMYIYVSAHDLALQSSALLMSSQIDRLGMPQDPARWFARQLNNAPANTTIIDTSNLHQTLDFIGHRIPFEAIGYVHGLKSEKWSSLFAIDRPFSMNPHFWQLRCTSAGLHF